MAGSIILNGGESNNFSCLEKGLEGKILANDLGSSEFTVDEFGRNFVSLLYVALNEWKG